MVNQKEMWEIEATAGAKNCEVLVEQVDEGKPAPYQRPLNKMQMHI